MGTQCVLLPERRTNPAPSLHFPHCIQMDIHQDPSSFQPLRSPLGLRVRHSVAIFAIQLLLSFSNALSQNGVRRRLQASSTLSRSHIASHHVASHRKASHAAQLLSSSQTSRGSCTDPQYKARATTAKNHARAHAARSRYPPAHPRPHPAPRKACPPSSARPNHHWSRIKRPPAARRGCRSTRRPSRLLSGLAAPRLPSDLSFDAHPSRSGRA